jgi:DNA repair protein RadC
MAVATLEAMPLLLALNPDGRPRERLAAQGAGPLSDAELLAVVLGAGVVGLNVVDVAHGLLARTGGLHGLARASIDEIRGQAGVGIARAAAVLAALEIGRRSVGERPARGQRISSAEQVWTHLRARLSACQVEEFWALALDVRHRVLWEACLARIFCHNHPSGDPSPSRQDLDLTVRLRDVGELCGINVLDHVIVGTDGFTSLAQEYWTRGTLPLQSPR